jgi:hypothetical protein
MVLKYYVSPFVLSPSVNQPLVLRLSKETVGFLRTGLSKHDHGGST